MSAQTNEQTILKEQQNYGFDGDTSRAQEFISGPVGSFAGTLERIIGVRDGKRHLQILESKAAAKTDAPAFGLWESAVWSNISRCPKKRRSCSAHELAFCAFARNRDEG
jgi:hypothetical protein